MQSQKRNVRRQEGALVKLAVKFGLLVGVLFVGILFGINTAEKGMQRIEGTTDLPGKSFVIKKVEGGKMEVEVLGKQVASGVPISSGKAVTGNWLSQVGGDIRTFVIGTTRTVMEWIMSKL
ncbi:uncharacterized protein DUF3679 [Aneurinibacillus soli]|uniref:Uncharacterized protein n=1 Tax=Aneurinibacillus soli TaxID=1500254 RepID=A0A0U5B1I6_9BACL|nr:uncharacterized protein DUF3679 [Aneurinibacillus soli]BAU27167.1 hypothetical protein CB4_01336 [Aneurinibacillus soli]